MGQHLLDGLTPAQIAGVRLLCEQSHLYFARLFFKAKTNGQASFKVGRHHKVMCDTIDRVFSGEIKRLIISVPPRYSKTELATLYLVARGFAINPRAQFLHSSYSDKLVNDNSSKIRNIVRSPEFQTLWPLGFQADSDAKGLWKTDAGGALTVAPSDGQVTGFGAGLMEPGFTGALIIDDPLKPRDASSDTMRQAVNENYMGTFRSRIATDDVPIIVIMQRIHSDDFAANLLTGAGGEKFHHLMLPVEIDNSRGYPTEYTSGIPIPHGLSDGPLWPEKHDEAQIDILRKDAKVFASQYMQDPRVSDNGAFKPTMFRSYEVRPRTLNVAIVVDPSGGGSSRSDTGAKRKSDRTAMAVIGIDANANKYLLDGVCHRMPLSERWDNLKRLWQRWARMPGVMGVTVGYEKVGMQSDIDYIHERQQIDGAHFAIEEVNWPRSGGQSKEDRIQRLEPDFGGNRFFLPATIYRAEEGGNCFWEGSERGVIVRRAYGKTSAQKRVITEGEGDRVADTIKKVDENGQMYDVSWTLMQELLSFPNASHDDLSDAVSRIYDLDVVPANRREVNELEALNAALEA